MLLFEGALHLSAGGGGQQVCLADKVLRYCLLHSKQGLLLLHRTATCHPKSLLTSSNISHMAFAASTACGSCPLGLHQLQRGKNTSEPSPPDMWPAWLPCLLGRSMHLLQVQPHQLSGCIKHAAPACHSVWLPLLLQIERFLRKELRIVQWVALAAFVMQVLVVLLACALTQAQQNALLENERWACLAGD